MTLHMGITRSSYLNQIFYIFFVAEDGEDLYGQQKQEWELTMAHIMNSLSQNLGLNWSRPNYKPFRSDLNQILYMIIQ